MTAVYTLTVAEVVFDVQKHNITSSSNVVYGSFTFENQFRCKRRNRISEAVQFNDFTSIYITLFLLLFQHIFHFMLLQILFLFLDKVFCLMNFILSTIRKCLGDVVAA